jgi:hypothetical protein
MKVAPISRSAVARASSPALASADHHDLYFRRSPGQAPRRPGNQLQKLPPSRRAGRIAPRNPSEGYTSKTVNPLNTHPQPNKPLTIAYHFARPAHNKVMAISSQFAIHAIFSKISGGNHGGPPPIRPQPHKDKRTYTPKTPFEPPKQRAYSSPAAGTAGKATPVDSRTTSFG